MILGLAAEAAAHVESNNVVRATKKTTVCELSFSLHIKALCIRFVIPPKGRHPRVGGEPAL